MEVNGKRRIFYNRQKIITSTLAIWTSVFAGTAHAQQTEASSSINELEEIVITGSHIRKDNFSSSSPLTVLDGDAMGKVGAVNVGEFLTRIPSISGDVTGSSANVNSPQSTGLNTIALRNLGASRTLVLVNGRRYVSGTSAGAGYGVDLNSIPASMIERVEVLTGGQSAAYGSDALAGVVNIITKRDFEGISVKAQYGVLDKGDRKKKDLELSIGSNFGNGGNAWVSFGYSDDAGLMAQDRDFAHSDLTAVDNDGDGLAETLQFVGSSHIPTGRIGGFKGDGTPFVRTPSADTSDAFNFHLYRSMHIPAERKFAAAGLTYPVSDQTTVHVEANFARVETSGRFEPIPLDTRNNIFEVSRGGSTGINLDPALGAVHPLFDGTALQASLLGTGVQHLDDVSLTFRRLVEFGTRGSDNKRDTFRIAAGLEHEFGNGFVLDLSSTYGFTNQVQTDLGDINLERARFALDIVSDGRGGYQCADAIARIDGCVPFNPFNGPADPLGIGISPEAVDYLAAAVGLEGEVEQFVASAVLSGDLPFKITEGNNVSFAAGLEYREESGKETPDGLRQKGITRGYKLFPTNGSFDVIDAFAEIYVPLGDKLTLDAAIRIGDYSSVGTTTTWKVGLDAPVADWVRLRAAYASSVRAPNVSDLFAGGSATAAFVFDPCNGVDATTSGNAADNCRSIQAIADRIASEGAFNLTQVESQNTSGIVGGSTSVEEEKATSFTVGAVFTPSEVLRGLSLAVDYYDIKIDDAIANTDRTVILNRCFNAAPSDFDPTCGGLVRRDINSGAALDVNSSTNNENTIETNGLDIELSYSTELGAGEFSTSAMVNFLFDYDITGIETGDVQKLAGEVLFPKTRANVNFNYDVNNWAISWRLRYWGSTVDRNTGVTFAPELNELGAKLYNDLRISYTFSDSYSLYVGAQNIFNSKPHILGTNAKYHEAGTNSNGTAYDLTGRQWYAGLRATF